MNLVTSIPLNRKKNHASIAMPRPAAMAPMVTEPSEKSSIVKVVLPFVNPTTAVLTAARPISYVMPQMHYQ